MSSEDTRPGIPAPLEATCTASTPADGIMVGCDMEGPHERHRGTYVREFAGVGVDVEVSWLTGEPAERVLSVPADERAAIRGAAETDAGATAAPLDRETLGRLVHDVRLAHNAERERPFGLLPWEEREARQQELDRRIGEAVARAATAGYENAITWGTSCLSCSRVLDSAYAERERAERAEARLAGVAKLNGGSGWLTPAEVQRRIWAITGDGQEGSDEKGGDHG